MQDALVISRARRVMRVRVAPELILDMLKISTNGLTVGDRRIFCVSDPIPLTAQLFRFAIDQDGYVTLYITDDSFASIADGELIPELVPVYESKEPN